jgi:hypothetical protein
MRDSTIEVSLAKVLTSLSKSFHPKFQFRWDDPSNDRAFLVANFNKFAASVNSSTIIGTETEYLKGFVSASSFATAAFVVPSR